MNKKVIMLMVGAATLALVQRAEAQKPAKVQKIGFLASPGSGPIQHFYEVFRDGLRELGYVDGKNIAFEYRSAGSGVQLAELATELVGLKVDVIVTPGGTTAAAKRATEMIPIVFSYSGDPVEAGFINSLARPGRNMTGITWLAFELVGKRLEILKEAAPRISRVAVLANPAHPGEQRELRETQSTAQPLGIALQHHQVKASAEFEAAFDSIVRENANALLVFPESVTLRNSKRIAEFAAKHRLPSMFAWKEYVEDGGLMAYGPNRIESIKRLAVYVDKILKGATPAQLPAEQPTKFELIINLKAAKQIGLTIPPNVLARADRVIK
jgi:putative tryptophan/tyrosine transport system substrate-binding protein